jgi:hypothetical protein
MDKLYLQKIQLGELVEDFKTNNEGYLKVRENVKQKVESTITSVYTRSIFLALQLSHIS